MTEEILVPDCVQLIGFPERKDARGSLMVGELASHVPFDCKRIFMVYGVPAEVQRGAHAHRECHQLLIAASGSVRVHVDDSVSSGDVQLDSPAEGLYLPPMTWGMQYDYSSDCTLLVLASHRYDADDYIHDHAEFLKISAAKR